MKITAKKQLGDYIIEVSIDDIQEGVGSKVEELLDTLMRDRKYETTYRDRYFDGEKSTDEPLA